MKKVSLSKLTCLIFLGCFLSGCSLFLTRGDIEDEEGQGSPYVGVDVDPLEEKSVPNIEEKDISGSDSYGPDPLQAGAERATKENVRNPIIALYVAPGLYRSLASLGFYQKLLREDVNVRMFSGEGMGALLATLFASEITPERAEWLFFKFLNAEAEELSPFTGPWREALAEVYHAEIPYRRIQETPIKLTLPVYSLENGKILFRHRGDMRDSLTSQFLVDSQSMESKWISPLGRQTKPIQGLFKMGADLVIVLDVLGKNIAFQEAEAPSMSLKSLYRQSGKNLRAKCEQKNLWALCFDLSLEKIDLDEAKELPLIIQQGRRVADEAIPTIRKLIRQWKKDRVKSDKS